MSSIEKECELQESIKVISSRWAPNTFTFKTLKKNDILQDLKMLNPNKSAGYEQLLPRVLKMAADELATPLTTIFNQAIEEKVRPKAWKMGEWIPVFKKEDPLDKVNYRPITIQITIAKIFEQLLCKH